MDELKASKETTWELKAQVAKDTQIITKERAWVIELEVKLANFESKGAIIEIKHQTIESRTEAVEARAQATEYQVEEARTRVVEEYKGSQAFKDKVVEATLDAFKLRFIECKKVAKTFPALDLSNINDAELEEEAEWEEGGEGKEANKEVRVEVKVVSIEEVIELPK